MYSKKIQSAEFFGLPGAGKTSLMYHVANISQTEIEFATERNSVQMRSGLFLGRLNEKKLSRIFTRRNREFSTFVLAAADAMNRRERKKVRADFFASAARKQALLNSRGNLTTLESEGMMQRLLGFCVRLEKKQVPNFISTYLELAPMPDFLFSVEVDPVLAESRLRSRTGTGRRDSLEKEIWQHCFRAVNEEIEKKGRRVFYFDGSLPLDRNTQTIIGHLK